MRAMTDMRAAMFVFGVKAELHRHPIQTEDAGQIPFPKPSRNTNHNPSTPKMN